MKTAIYIEDGIAQLVITPENEFEKNALRSFEDKPTITKIMVGSFYNCKGGWTRHARTSEYDYSASEDRSLIIRVDANQQLPTEAQ